MKKKKAPSLKAKRLKLGINQTRFWARVGVTQSGGSRHESGTNPITKPVALMIDLVYGDTPLATLAALRGVTKEQLIEGGL